MAGRMPALPGRRDLATRLVLIAFFRRATVAFPCESLNQFHWDLSDKHLSQNQAIS